MNLIVAILLTLTNFASAKQKKPDDCSADVSSQLIKMHINVKLKTKENRDELRKKFMDIQKNYLKSKDPETRQKLNAEFKEEIQNLCKTDFILCNQHAKQKRTAEDGAPIYDIEKYEDEEERDFRPAPVPASVEKERKESEEYLMSTFRTTLADAELIVKESKDLELVKKAKQIIEEIHRKMPMGAGISDNYVDGLGKSGSVYTRVRLYKNDVRAMFYTVSNRENPKTPRLQVHLKNDCKPGTVFVNGVELTPERCTKKTTLDENRGCDLLGFTAKKIDKSRPYPWDFIPDKAQ
jgi:hypothetical protein